MSVTGIAGRSGLQIQSLMDLRQQLDDLQRQLGSGQKVDRYEGLGLARGLAMGLRTQVATLKTFDATAQTLFGRLDLAQTALTQIGNSAKAVRTSTVASKFVPDQSGQTADQHSARGQFEQMLDALNTQFGDQYIFSGKSPDQQAVGSADYILNGDATHAGFTQIMDERRQADLGADGLGRLQVSTALGAVNLAEDAAPPFGLKLASVASTLTGAVVAPPAGAPAAMSVDFSAATLAEGDAVKLGFTLPDGTSANITLTATTANPPGANQFTIGGSATATAANFSAALTSSIATLAGTSLKAASAMAAANDFFTSGGNPQQRVAGPPFDSATAQVAGTSADTVAWYTGETGSDPARASAIARVDPSIVVSFGMRADEQALRNALASVAVFATASFSPSDANAAGAYTAMLQRVGANLSEPAGQQKISDIAAEIAGAQTTATAATERHQQTTAALADLLQSVEGISPDEVGAKILTLQTRLQASLQTTALLSKISLVNYL